MGGGEANFKSFQARQGLQYVQDRPKFIQDFMQRTGTHQPGAPQVDRPDRERDPGWDDDEMPMMVDSEGNMISMPDTPTPHKAHQSKLTLPDEEDEQALEFLETSLAEFEHEALHPSEVTQQPASKRNRPAMALRERPKTSSKDSRLLSFTMDDGDEEGES